MRKKYTHEELANLHRQVEAELKNINDVVGVGFGLKAESGILTDEIAFRAFVKEKKRPEDIDPSELIPKTIYEFKTDVIEVPKDIMMACEDSEQHRPVVGGITVCNYIAGKDLFPGTLGYFATINGNTSRDNIAFITNNHVVTANNGGKENDKIYQPRIRVMPLESDILPAEIGRILKVPPERKNYPYQYPGENFNPIPEYYLDCAAVKLNTDYSSTCNTNWGIDFRKEIKNLNIGGSNTIVDIDRIKYTDIYNYDATDTLIPYKVHKVGRTTGRTEGQVIAIGDVAFTMKNENPYLCKNIITISTGQENCKGEKQFSDEGDSGSVVVNSKNMIVGLLYGGSRPTINGQPVGHETKACCIHPVLSELELTILTNPLNTNTQNRFSTLEIDLRINKLEQEARQERLEFLRDKIRLNNAYIIFSDLFQKHKGEILDLVNHIRHITIAWHRNNGPVFIAHFIKNFHEPDYKVPTEIKGITLPNLLKAMQSLLLEYGSSNLKEAIIKYGDQIIACSENCTSLETLLYRISNIQIK